MRRLTEIWMEKQRDEKQTTDPSSHSVNINYHEKYIRYSNITPDDLKITLPSEQPSSTFNKGYANFYDSILGWQIKQKINISEHMLTSD